MPPEKCTFESEAQRQNVDFFSRKTRPNHDELVLNPEPTRKVISAITGGSSPTVNDLYGICDKCGLCKPEIRPEGEGFRVYRLGYEQFVSNVPLATFTQFHAEKPKTGVRVVVVDDFSPTSGAQYYSLKGIESLAVKINPDVRPSQMQERAVLRQIEEWKPDWVISDKGLGYFNGIDLILGCKEAGIKTIMHTGEEQTAETRRVADMFIQKASISPERMVEILTSG